MGEPESPKDEYKDLSNDKWGSFRKRVLSPRNHMDAEGKWNQASAHEEGLDYHKLSQVGIEEIKVQNKQLLEQSEENKQLLRQSLEKQKILEEQNSQLMKKLDELSVTLTYKFENVAQLPLQLTKEDTEKLLRHGKNPQVWTEILRLVREAQNLIPVEFRDRLNVYLGIRPPKEDSRNRGWFSWVLDSLLR